MEYSVRHAVLITVLIAITGIATAAVSGTVAAQSETDIQWTGAGANGFPTTQDIQVEAVDSQNLISFGANTGRSLRVQNVDTGDSITLTPTNTTTYQVEEFELNFNSLVNIQADGEYEEAQDPEMSLTVNQTAPPDYPVNVEGDPTKFFEQTFYEYNVQVIDSNGTVIAETDDTKIRGSGYEESYRYNGSAVGVERDSGVQPEWYVILEQYDPDAETTYTYTGDYNENSEYIIFNTDSNFDPNNDFDIVISANETQRIDLENEIISLFGVEVANPEGENNLKIVDGPIRNTDSEPNQDSSQEVKIRAVNIAPSSDVDSDPQEYNLRFEAHNVSADGNKDEFDITFPAEVGLADDPDVSIGGLSSEPRVNQTGNTVEFTVNPNGTQSVRTLTVGMNVTLSAEGNN